jgi:hypothetical protein
VHVGRGFAHRVEQLAGRGCGSGDLQGDDAHPARRLHGSEDAGALEPELRLVARAELDGPLQDALRPIRVSAAQQRLSQPAVDLTFARGEAARRDEDRLGVGKAARVDVGASLLDELFDPIVHEWPSAHPGACLPLSTEPRVTVET